MMRAIRTLALLFLCLILICSSVFGQLAASTMTFNPLTRRSSADPSPQTTPPSLPAEFLPLYAELTKEDNVAIDDPSGRFDLLFRSSAEVLMPSQKPRVNELALLVFEQRISIINRYDAPAYDLELKIMLLSKELPGYQFIFEERIWPEAHMITEDAEGNRFAIIRCSSLRPGEKLLVTVSYNLVNTSWETDKSQLYRYADSPRDPEALEALRPEYKIESDHPEIVAMAKSIVGSETNPYRKAELLYSWVNVNMSYDEDKQYAHMGAYAALRSMRGVCTENASLLVALLRASGVPARLVGGYLFKNEAKEDSSVVLNGNMMAHTWVEFYLEGFGWIPCEPTYELIEGDVRSAALKYFAALPQWGHVVSNYDVLSNFGLGKQFDVTYSGYKDMLVGEVIPTFQYGQRLMDNEIKIYLNDWNQRVFFADQQPVLKDGVTMVPMRRIYELLGADVIWDDEQKRILARYQDRIVELQIDRSSVWVNGEYSELLIAPYIDARTRRTLIPLRAVSEGLGAEVIWDPLLRRILILTS